MKETLHPPDNIELRHAESPSELAVCFPVMHQLRPQLASATEFVERVARQQTAGYRLLAAWDHGRPVGLAGYRTQENLIRGPFIYVDDLVVSVDRRSAHLGARLLDAVADECRRLRIPSLVLDAAIDNSLGHRFYFRYGMLARGLHFSMAIRP
jgi:GNAT superfamily N-acetyltransferase